MYEQHKDKLLKFFEKKQDKSSFLISIFSYDNGQPKVALTKSFEKKDGSVGYGNSGRISIDELKFLREKIDEIINLMEKYINVEKIS